MFLKSFLKTPTFLQTLNSALSQLNSINFFAVLYEIAAERISPRHYPNPAIDTYSLRAAWHDGYIAAIDDIYNFNEKYVQQKVANLKIAPDFGAKAALVASKDIEKEEDYDGISRSK